MPTSFARTVILTQDVCMEPRSPGSTSPKEDSLRCASDDPIIPASDSSALYATLDEELSRIRQLLNHAPAANSGGPLREVLKRIRDKFGRREAA